MTTERHSLGADDDPGVTRAADPPADTGEDTRAAAPEGRATPGGAPDSGPPGEAESPVAEPPTGTTEWDGYVLPSPIRAESGHALGPQENPAGPQIPAWATGGHGAHDAGWARPAGDVWPSNRPVERTNSYLSLRRPVDDQSSAAPDRVTAAAADVDGDDGDQPTEQTGASPLPRRKPGESVAERVQRGGKHARRVRTARTSRVVSEDGAAEGPVVPVSNQDDPENLAGWVDDLAVAVDDDNDTSGAAVIAGRRSGSQVTSRSGSSAGASGDEPARTPRETESTTESTTTPRIETEPPGTDTPHRESGSDGAGGPLGRDFDTGPAAAPMAEWDPSDDADDEYRPSSGEPWQPMPATTREELIRRLDNLALLIELGRDDFDPELIARARGLLTHAGARLRLSGDHTIVALAGGTGSGKSSLFNALCGLEFSRVGITRPTTSSAHACVWGNEGADSILEWLGVPQRARHSRTSVLDKGTSELHGLILLDLPDHDSVQAVHTERSDRLISSADLLVWVLDPQKYADAAVHHRYFAEMAGHGGVTVAVLNKVDQVEPDELEEILTDLRRLLETESGAQPRMLTTSTLTGDGLRELRELLAQTVSERRALVDRLVADLERIVSGFDRYRGDETPLAQVPEDARERLADELVRAGGVPAVADTAGNAYERRGHRSMGWPVGRWMRALRRDPLRAVKLDFVREGAEEGLSEPVRAQLPEVETAAAEVAETAGGSLPAPWPRRLRAAARSNVSELPRELGDAISGTVPEGGTTPLWWTIVRLVQYLLVVIAGAGLAWLGFSLVSWLAGGLTGVSLLDHPINIGFAAAVTIATLIVGKLTEIGCRNLVEVAAAQQRDEVERRSAQRVRSIADERIVAPLEEELQRYRAYTDALDAASARHAE